MRVEDVVAVVKGLRQNEEEGRLAATKNIKLVRISRTQVAIRARLRKELVREDCERRSQYVKYFHKFEQENKGRGQEVARNIATETYKWKQQRANILHDALFRGFQQLQEKITKKICTVFIRHLAMPFTRRIAGKMFVRKKLRKYLAICNKLRIVNNSMCNYRKANLKKKSFKKWLEEVFRVSCLININEYKRVLRLCELKSKFSSLLKVRSLHQESFAMKYSFARWCEIAQKSLVKKRILELFKKFKSLQVKMRIFGVWKNTKATKSSCMFWDFKRNWMSDLDLNDSAMSIQIREKILYWKSRAYNPDRNSFSEKVRKREKLIRKNRRLNALGKSLKLYFNSFHEYIHEQMTKEAEIVRTAFRFRGSLEIITFSTGFIKVSNQIGVIVNKERKAESPTQTNHLLRYIRIHSTENFICGLQLIYYDLTTNHLYFDSLQGCFGTKAQEFELNSHLSGKPHFFFNDREYIIGIKLFLGKYIGQIKFYTNHQESKTYGTEMVGKKLVIGFSKLREMFKVISDGLIPLKAAQHEFANSHEDYLEIVHFSVLQEKDTIPCFNKFGFVFRGVIKMNIFSSYFCSRYITASTSYRETETTHLKPPRHSFGIQPDEGLSNIYAAVELLPIRQAGFNLEIFEVELKELLILRRRVIAQAEERAKRIAIKLFYLDSCKIFNHIPVTDDEMESIRGFFPLSNLNIVKALHKWLFSVFSKRFLDTYQGDKRMERLAREYHELLADIHRLKDLKK